MNRRFGTQVLDLACRMLAPFFLLFGVYVIAHGHYSPGGGFQGGAILASAFILMFLVRGRRIWGLSPTGALILGSGGFGLFLFLGILPVLRNFNFLDYSGLPFPIRDPEIRAFGTFWVEVGIAYAWGLDDP